MQQVDRWLDCLMDHRLFRILQAVPASFSIEIQADRSQAKLIKALQLASTKSYEGSNHWASTGIAIGIAAPIVLPDPNASLPTGHV